MSELGVREIELYDKIEDLQRTIETFVTDIGYDLEKFLNHKPPQKRKKTTPSSITPEVESKISKMLSENEVPSGDITNAFHLLPPNAKLELYSFLAENDKCSEANLSDLEFDPEERMKLKAESQEKSKLELLKLQRDSKRRRQKFKGGKVHSGCRTIMEKHRGLVNSILDDYASELGKDNVKNSVSVAAASSVEQINETKD